MDEVHGQQNKPQNDLNRSINKNTKEVEMLGASGCPFATFVCSFHAVGYTENSTFVPQDFTVFPWV